MSLTERGEVLLAFWRCGHIEVDDGTEHECDGRDVCMADFERYVPPSQLWAAVGDLACREAEIKTLCELLERAYRVCGPDDLADEIRLTLDALGGSKA